MSVAAMRTFTITNLAPAEDPLPGITLKESLPAYRDGTVLLFVQVN